MTVQKKSRKYKIPQKLARFIGEYIIKNPGKSSLQIYSAILETGAEITKFDVEKIANSLEEYGLIFSRREFIKDISGVKLPAVNLISNPTTGSDSGRYVKDRSGKFVSDIVYRPQQKVSLKSIQNFVDAYEKGLLHAFSQRKYRN